MSNRPPHILYFPTSRRISHTISKGRKCPPMALTAEPNSQPTALSRSADSEEIYSQTFCLLPLRSAIRFLRLSVNPFRWWAVSSALLGSLPLLGSLAWWLGVLPLPLPLCLARCCALHLICKLKYKMSHYFKKN